ncbi:MAG TPA: hypothetical protein PKZ53_26395, partial [Acidobacteriota bacterium]|nr:hypothetical protein [Acidobacteriota bacterium]HNJ44041.1 hypothetical protein [Acidobacteriota bacterium]
FILHSSFFILHSQFFILHSNPPAYAGGTDFLIFRHLAQHKPVDWVSVVLYGVRIIPKEPHTSSIHASPFSAQTTSTITVFRTGLIRLEGICL